jgi:hypothetical protein
MIFEPCDLIQYSVVDMIFLSAPLRDADDMRSRCCKRPHGRYEEEDIEKEKSIL